MLRHSQQTLGMRQSHPLAASNTMNTIDVVFPEYPGPYFDPVGDEAVILFLCGFDMVNAGDNTCQFEI
jgi:hypothetical protein